MCIREFLNTLAGEVPRCDAERFGAERYGSPRLSAFELLRTDEISLSNVIAELLDPRGAHGQGPLFLNALLGEINEPKVHVRDAVKITREFKTKGNRRIDILIETSKSLIGIENKPYARQGQSQLIDYHVDLLDRASGSTPRLVFLSNSEPETAKDVTTVLRFFDRSDETLSLFRLLSSVRNEIKAPRARGFVDDFSSWIARHFGGDQMTAELEPYSMEVQAQFRKASNRKAIGAVMLAAGRIRYEVINQIGFHILSSIQETYPDLSCMDGELCDCIDEQTSPWRLSRPSWPENCWLALEAERKEAGNVILGVLALQSETARAKIFPERICHDRYRFETSLHDVANGSSSDWWPWYQNAPTSNWSQEFVARLLIETNGQVENHEEVVRIRATMLRLIDTIEVALQSR